MANVGGVGQQLSFNFDVNSKQNARAGASAHSADLRKKADKTEERKLDSQSNIRSTRDAQGLTTTELEGQSVTTSASGVELTESQDGSFSLRLPTGYSLAGNADGKLVASDPNNRPLKVNVEETEQGPIYSFNDAAGNKVDVDPVTLDFGFADKGGNVSQLVRSDGSQVVVTKSQFRDPETREHSEIQTVTHFHPDGTVEADDGVRASNTSVGFELPTGAQVEYDLPYPVAGTLRQQAPAAEAPPAPQPDQVSLSGNGEAATPLFLQEPGFTPGGEAPQAPQSQEAGSGVMRTDLGDGRAITQLPNGIHLVSGDRPAAADSFGNEFGVAKDGGTYSFKDSKGNQYSLYDDSLAFKVTNPKGDVTQVVHQDGTQITNVKDGNQTYRWESGPGEPQIGVDGHLDVPNRGRVELPYWVPGQPSMQKAPYTSVETPTEPPPLPNSGKAMTTAASGVTRESLDDGRIKTTLPNGINLTDGEGHTPVASDARGNNFEVATTQTKSAGGPVEKRYTFTDSSGNKYTMFSDSMDFAVESPDSAVRQVVRPDGRILNLVRDGNVTHWSEIDPANRTQAATQGTSISDGNPGVINVPGRGAIPLPYRIPDPGTQFQATAGTEHLDSGMADKSMPGNNNHQSQQATFAAQPGQPQQGFKPGLWDRIKSVFTGENPWAKYDQAPPDQMGAHRMRPQMGGPDEMGHMYHRPGGPPPWDMGSYPGQHTNYQYDPMTAGMMRQMEAQDKMTNVMMMMTMGTSLISMLAMPMMMFFSPMSFMF